MICGGCGGDYERLAQHQSARSCYPEIVTPWAAWRELIEATQRRFANPTRHTRWRETTARSEFAEALERCP